MSAAWRPCSTARSIACSATTVLPEPDLPHEQPLHRSVEGEVGVDLGDRGELVRRRLERQPLGEPLVAQRRRVGQRLGVRDRAALGAQPQLDRLVEQQLVEGQPAPPGLAVADVRGDHRVRGAREALLPPQARREQLGDLVRRGEVLADQREDLRGRDALRRRVRRGRVADGGHGLGRRVVVHAEPPARLVLAGEHEPRPGPVVALEPRLVEERRLHEAGRVGDGGDDERLHPPPAHGARPDRAHLDEHRRGLVLGQRRDRARLARVAREVEQEVADGVQPEGLRRLGGLGPAGDLERLPEPFGVRPTDGDVVERVGACEVRRHLLGSDEPPP